MHTKIDLSKDMQIRVSVREDDNEDSLVVKLLNRNNNNKFKSNQGKENLKWCKWKINYCFSLLYETPTNQTFLVE